MLISKSFLRSSRRLVALVVTAPAALALAQPQSASLINNTHLTTATTGAMAVSPAQFTIEASFRPDGPGYGSGSNGAMIVCKPRQGSTGSFLQSWYLLWNPTTRRIEGGFAHVFGMSGVNLLSQKQVQVGETAHAALTFDGVVARLYVNGVQESSFTAGSSAVYYNANEPVLIGAGNFGAGFTRRWQGLIDDARIWSVARTAGEIAANAGCQLAGPQTGLLANWIFDGMTTNDVSGNGRDATFAIGAPAFGVPASGVGPMFSGPTIAPDMCPGGTIALSVVASGTGQTYGWRKNGVPIDTIANPTAATAALTISNAQVGDTGMYDCVATNQCGTWTSPAASAFIGRRGDANGDLAVTLADIAALVGSWTLTVPPAAPELDLDGSGTIGLGDIAIVVSNWNTSCP
jgi:hypothetical protein